MACLHSKPAWKAGLPNPNGKYSLRFKDQKRTPDYYIPCGKCEGCRADQAMEWGIRITHEAQMHDRNCFITLTYDDDHIPVDGKINRRDPQLFVKRLRKHSDRKIRYFLTGEYGETTNRPHYHAIIFGEDFLGGAKPIGDRMFTNPILDGIWKQGMCSIIPFEPATAMYTAGYTSKKIGAADTFSIMSRKPAIGVTWLRKYHNMLVQLGHTVMNGHEMPIPGVYFDWMEGVPEWDKLKQERLETMKQKPVKTDYQLRSKGLHMKSKQSLKEHKI